MDSVTDAGKLTGKLLDLADYFEPNDLTAATLIREAVTAIKQAERDMAERAAKAAWAVKPLPDYPVKPEEMAAFLYGKDCAVDAIRKLV